MAKRARQLPAGGEIFLDHVGWYVPDLDDVGRAFGRLGFPLTPYSVHGDRDPETGAIIAQGSANRLALLEQGYLEFLTAVEGTETPVGNHLRREMDRYIGVHLTAFSVFDAVGEADRLAGDGFRIQPTVHLRRTIEGADGADVEVAFTVVRAAFGSIPEGRIQTLAHHTPEHLWQRRYMAEANALIGLAEVVFSVADPAASAGRLAKFTGRSAIETETGMSVPLDRGKLTFFEPKDVPRQLGIQAMPEAPATVAIGLVSRDLAKTREFMRAQSVRLAVDEPNRLIVEPDEALGSALIVYPAHEVPALGNESP
ncbi:MAG: VOC family protein [Alphaproteobacteria bacterium]|nr:VOC family protein [Alphaproteobacteria bacterium]